MQLVDAARDLSNVGLLQVNTDAGYGSVCGANPAAADVVCRSMGYSHGAVSTSPCGHYGGADLCGAAGTPVVRLTSSGNAPALHGALALFLLTRGHGGLDLFGL